MAKTNAQVQGISEALGNASGSLVALSKIDCPFTTVVNRAKMTDLANDLMPRMGIERVSMQMIGLAQGESGTGNEPVYKLLNDPYDRVRFVGMWTSEVANDGVRIFSSSFTTDYIEISFYGTGLNMLTTRNGARDIAYTVDGAGGEVTITAYDGSTFGGGINFNINTIAPIKKGLTLGLHTIKIRATAASDLQLTGFEILNESSSLKTSPGVAYANGKKQYLSALDAQGYSSPIDSGSLHASRGGRVVTYLLNGEVKKAATPTDSSALTLSSTNHANEELIRSYHFREFGAGRSDDFSRELSGAGNRAFTLDDGSTTLIGNSIQITPAADCIELLVNGTGYIAFTFIGTGLDVMTKADIAGSNTLDVTIDGGSVLTLVNTDTDKTRILKIVSGLPYGSHTVRILRNTVTSASPRFTNFLVYGPKKPALPADSVELADYCVLGTYAATAVNSAFAKSTGVISKTPVREFTYVGTWTPTFGELEPHGRLAETATNADYAEYTFFGTGFDLCSRDDGTANTVTIRIDGALYTGAATVLGNNAPTWTPGTSTWASNAAGRGSKLQITGLTLGMHIVRITKASGSGIRLLGIDIATPIHSHKSSLPGQLQNMLTVGSQSVGDSRSLSDTFEQDIPNWSQAQGVTANPSTNSAAAVPMPDMACVVKTDGKPLDIFFSGTFNMTSGAYVIASVGIYVDGIQVATGRDISNQTSTGRKSLSIGCIAPVAPGTHIIQVMWSSDGTNSLGGVSTLRTLCVKEL